MSGTLDRRQGSELAGIAAEIEREHEAAQNAFRSAVAHAIRCGKLLLEAKAALPHGSWGRWIAENFPASDRTAQGYMRLARADAQGLAHLGIEGALRELASGRPQEEPPPDDLPPEPKREDYGEGHLEEARFALDEAAYLDDRLVAHYRKILADAAEVIAADPVEGSALVALAATGIEFLIANRELEQTEAPLWAEAFKNAGKAWRVHRQARDAWYAAISEPLMDERPLTFNDAVYLLGEAES